MRAPKEKPRAGDLLAWYDRHARSLPWRAKRGERPDPYRVWLSEIMLQQTNVTTVKPYYEKFLARWPDVLALAAAPVEEVMRAWAGLGYYSRARNLSACAKAVVEKHGGRFPETEAELRALPGIGVYTAAAIAAVAFDRRAVVIDGNVERVISRLFAVEAPLPAAKKEIRAAADSVTPARRAGDFAQAMMDLGASVCAPQRPACALCPWMRNCRALARGDPESFPRKPRRREKTMRYGAAFVVTDAEGRLLVRTRPPKGLLGGMTETPTSEWSAGFHRESGAAHAPFAAPWKKAPAPARHVFTHFPLTLDVFYATIERAAAPAGMRWIEEEEIRSEAFPTLFRKVLAAATRTAPALSSRPGRGDRDRSRPD